MKLTAIYNSQPVIAYADGDELLHLESNNYQCDDPTCPCKPDPEMMSLQELADELQRRQAQDEHDETGTHAPNCRCGWCEPSESR